MGDKIVIIIISIGLILFVICAIPFMLLFWSFGNDEIVDLSNIDATSKEEIIELISLSDIANDVQLLRLQRPTVYRDIYYEIYFSSNNSNLIENLTENDDKYHRQIINIDDNEYCCTISKNDDSMIEILDNMFK